MTHDNNEKSNMKKTLCRSIAGLIFLGVASQVQAGGLFLYEIGTEDLGLASAGTAARAQDASTVAGNPAGMTRLDGKQLTVGAQVLYGDMTYDLNNPDLEGPGNVVGWLPAASSFYSHSISDDLKLGMALYGNFGLSLNFDDDWAGRYLVKEATLMGVTLQPSVAYRINKMWSVGAGLGLNFGIFSLTRDKLLSGEESDLDDTDLAPNGKLSVMFEPCQYARFGLTYTSEVDYEFDIDASGNLPINGMPWTLPIDASVDAPQQAMFSTVLALNEKWSLLGNIGWQDWGSFSDLAISVGPATRSSNLELQDTWHGALGTQYQMTAATRLNFGIAYDTSMYEDQDSTSFSIPSGAAWRFGTGVQQQLNEKSSFGVAFEYLLSEDASVPTPALLSGSYDNPEMFFFSVNYSCRF
jgi:long-chain fatty acid transport protein